MIVFYRDESVEVTSTAVRVNGRRYRYEELTRLWHHRARRSWRAVAGRGAWGLTLFLPVVTSVATLLVALRMDISAGTRVVLVLAALLVGVGAALLLDPVLDKMDSSFDRGVWLHEIWAERDGVAICLLQTPDASRFGRIYRALQRAVETPSQPT